MRTDIVTKDDKKNGRLVNTVRYRMDLWGKGYRKRTTQN